MTRVARRRSAPASLLLGLALCTGTASAQIGAHAGVDAAQIGDVPAGPATLRVVVVQREDAAPAVDLEVSLFALGRDGQPGIRRAATGEDGSATFAGIANDPEAVYLLGVRYDDVPFGARASFAAGATELVTTIEVAPRSVDPAPLRAGRVELRVDPGCAGIRISESHGLANPSDRVLYVLPDDRSEVGPLLRLPLPPGAAGFTSGGSPFDERMAQQGDEVLVFGPLYPGDNTLSFSYSLPASGEALALERRLPLGARSAAVLTAAGAPTATGPGLTAAGGVEADGVAYESVTTGPLDPGAALAFEVSAGGAAETSGSVAIGEVRAWLELDDVVLDVREQYALQVEGSEVARSETGAPLLCLSLPAGAEDLRFSQEAFALGVQPDASGGLALRGPLPPGESVLALSYDLRSGPDGATYRQRFGADVALLSLFVADNGVVAETPRLHRRRPIRTSDRTFLHLEAFQIGADETVAVDLVPIETPGRLPRAAGIGFVAGAAVLVAGVLLGPLRRASTTPAEVVSSARDTEREAVVQAIRDLDDDFETGKISDEDHRVMRAELRAQAAELVRAQRRSDAAPAAVAAPVCGRCGAGVGADARFCSQCGAALAAGDGAGATGA